MSRRPLGCLFEIAETLALTIIIFLVIQNFVAQPYRVEQQSMEQTLQEGQYVLVDKLTPRFDDYSRGDIVVFTPPERGPDAVPFIKRVIGVPGDRVTLVDGAVQINGHPLDEPYVFGCETAPGGAAEGTAPPAEETAPGETFPDEEFPDEVLPEESGCQPSYPQSDRSEWVIEPGTLFVMGDHREESRDSRQFDAITTSSVIGRAWLRYWPITALSILDTPRYPDLTPDSGLAPSPVPSPAP